jgi:flagellar biogenesis protein FliO
MSAAESVFSRILPGSATTTTSDLGKVAAQVALIYGSTWVLWKLVRRVAAKKKTSSLESVAGPDGASLLAGKQAFVSG